MASKKILPVAFCVYASLPLIANNSTNRKYVALTKAVMDRLRTLFNYFVSHIIISIRLITTTTTIMIETLVIIIIIIKGITINKDH